MINNFKNNNAEYFKQLQQLVDVSEIVIDRPKNSTHPKYPSFIYPVDYGYLKNTSASDGNEIDIWVGLSKSRQIDGILCTVDTVKKDVETKIVCGCTNHEIDLIIKTMNTVLKAIYIPNQMKECLNDK